MAASHDALFGRLHNVPSHAEQRSDPTTTSSNINLELQSNGVMQMHSLKPMLR